MIEESNSKVLIPKLIEKTVIMITQIAMRRILERNSSICLSGIPLEEEEKDILYHYQIDCFLIYHYHCQTNG